jgi:hypothetical protein
MAVTGRTVDPALSGLYPAIVSSAMVKTREKAPNAP